MNSMERNETKVRKGKEIRREEINTGNMGKEI